MKYINNLYQYLNKTNNFERFLILLIFLMIFLLIFKNNNEGFVQKNKNIVTYTDLDIYDDFYSNLYDYILYNKYKNIYELEIVNNNKPLNKTSNVLDIGCGTGNHVNQICSNESFGAKTIGIDISPSMIKVAKQNYPKCKFRVGNALKIIEFEENTFSHITCLYFTIYYIKDKLTFFNNCYHWLKPKGTLTLHLVNIYKFDTEIDGNTYNKSNKSNNSNNSNNKSILNFNDFKYVSEFELNESKISIFKETIKFENSNKVRINEHKLYMIPEKKIIDIALSCGFTVLSIDKMKDVGYNYNYLYTLVK